MLLDNEQHKFCCRILLCISWSTKVKSFCQIMQKTKGWVNYLRDWCNLLICGMVVLGCYSLRLALFSTVHCLQLIYAMDHRTPLGGHTTPRTATKCTTGIDIHPAVPSRGNSPAFSGFFVHNFLNYGQILTIIFFGSLSPCTYTSQSHKCVDHNFSPPPLHTVRPSNTVVTIFPFPLSTNAHIIHICFLWKKNQMKYTYIFTITLCENNQWNGSSFWA